MLISFLDRDGCLNLNNWSAMIFDNSLILMCQERLHFPVVIPTCNNVTYLKRTIDFFKSRDFNEFLIMDNGSSYPPMLEFLHQVAHQYTVLLSSHNPGPREFYKNKDILDWLPNYFIVTDPDLIFKEELDRKSIDYLIEITEKHQIFKVGSALALEMTEPNILDIPARWCQSDLTIRLWERSFWENIFSVTNYGDVIYKAPIDTTFALYNKKYDTGLFMHNNLRVAGRYTAKHCGWMEPPPIPLEEYEFYRNAMNAKHSSSESIKSGLNYG